MGDGGGRAGPGGLLLLLLADLAIEVRVGVRGGGGGFEAAAPDDTVEAVFEGFDQGLGRGVCGVEARDADLGDDGVPVGRFGRAQGAHTVGLRWVEFENQELGNDFWGRRNEDRERERSESKGSRESCQTRFRYLNGWI